MSDLANNAQSWVHTDLGHQVIAAEQATLESVFSHLFGYYLVQIGHPLFGKVTQSSLVNHRVFVTEIHEGQPHEGDSIVLASPEALPIACNSVDVVFLPHILENLATPALALREAYRILRPEGRLVVCGFNPWSLWPRWARHAQGGGQLIPLSSGCIIGWLDQLGCAIEVGSTFFHRFPLTGLKGDGKLAEWRVPVSLYGGALYYVVAIKRCIPLTPLLVKSHLFADTAKNLTGAVAPSRPISPYTDGGNS